MFIGNLWWDVSWQDLKDHVNGIVGDVERADVMTEPGGRSKGSGMVKFANAEAAQRAIDELNETDFNGRTFFVRADRGGSGKGGGGPVRSVGRGGRIAEDIAGSTLRWRRAAPAGRRRARACPACPRGGVGYHARRRKAECRAVYHTAGEPRRAAPAQAPCRQGARCPASQRVVCPAQQRKGRPHMVAPYT